VRRSAHRIIVKPGFLGRWRRRRPPRGLEAFVLLPPPLPLQEGFAYLRGSAWARLPSPAPLGPRTSPLRPGLRFVPLGGPYHRRAGMSHYNRPSRPRPGDEPENADAEDGDWPIVSHGGVRMKGTPMSRACSHTTRSGHPLPPEIKPKNTPSNGPETTSSGLVSLSMRIGGWVALIISKSRASHPHSRTPLHHPLRRMCGQRVLSNHAPYVAFVH